MAREQDDVAVGVSGCQVGDRCDSHRVRRDVEWLEKIVDLLVRGRLAQRLVEQLPDTVLWQLNRLGEEALVLATAALPDAECETENDEVGADPVVGEYLGV